MATVGIGYKQVWQMMVEMSLHLIEPISITTLSSAITASTQPQIVTLGSTANLIAANYVIVDPGLSTQEAVLLGEVTATQIEAIFAQNHSSGAVLIGACFPTQSGSDPFFTQSEILSYISRAQNEFLTRVSCYLALTFGQINYGQINQSLPCTPIELMRVAISATNVPITSLVRSSGVVTATTGSAHDLSVGSKFTILNPANSTFAGAFKAATITSSTIFTYNQVGGANASTSGGTVSLWSRLKEVTQEMLSMTNPGWQTQYRQLPSSYYEDRTGNYVYGIDCRPAANFPTELLMSIRDTDLLGMTDGFLVPDLLIHIVKYRALQYCWEKDGVQRSPTLAAYCQMRFDRGVMASLRWLDNMMNLQAASPIKQRAQRQAVRA